MPSILRSIREGEATYQYRWRFEPRYTERWKVLYCKVCGSFAMVLTEEPKRWRRKKGGEGRVVARCARCLAKPGYRIARGAVLSVGGMKRAEPGQPEPMSSRKLRNILGKIGA